MTDAIPTADCFDVVHVVYYPFPADPRVRRYALAARDAGLRVAVIALATGKDSPGVSEWSGIHLVRLPGSKRRGSVRQYVQEYGGFVVRARRAIAADARMRSARLIHVHTLPDFLVAAAKPARERGAKVILDLHEIFPEFTRSKFGGVAGRLAGGVAQWLERWSRRQADHTVSVNRPIEALLRGREAYAGEPLTIVHNMPDPGDFGPVRPPAIHREPGPLRTVYHGTLTPLYGLDLAVGAVAAARASGADVRFDIYGDGPQRGALAAQIASLGLEDAVRLHDPVPAAVLRERLPTYHAGLIPTREDEMTAYSLSTKLLEYVHLGLPVVAPGLRTYREYFPADAFVWFTPNDAASMGDAIVRLTRLAGPERAVLAARAQAAVADLAWTTEREKILAVYASLLGRPVRLANAA